MIHTVPKGDRLVITVDGPAGAGKGSVCRALADRLPLAYLETGALYRALGLLALREEGGFPSESMLAHWAASMPFTFRVVAPHGAGEPRSFEGGGGKWHAFLADERVTDLLREENVGQAASRVAAMPSVRQALMAFQRRYGGGDDLILDGRDVGTVVWPDADVKIYLTASLAERAKRRALELQRSGANGSFPRVLAGMMARDERDRRRSHAPLVSAPDAIQVDTTGLTLVQAVQAVASHLPPTCLAYRAGPASAG